MAQRDMGKKSFGYVVKKHKEAIYYQYDFDLSPGKLIELQRTLTLTEPILRFSVFIKNQDLAKALPPKPPMSSPKPPTTARV